MYRRGKRGKVDALCSIDLCIHIANGIVVVAFLLEYRGTRHLLFCVIFKVNRGMIVAAVETVEDHISVSLIDYIIDQTIEGTIFE